MTTQPVPQSLAASVHHLELINQSLDLLEKKVKRLKSVRADALAQIATATKRYIDDQPRGVEPAFLLDLYESLKTVGLFTAWKTAGLPHPERLRADVQAATRHTPNDPVSGGWVGEWIALYSGTTGYIEGNYPADGVPVVYVLYGPDAGPVYCGSSERFYARLIAHQRNGKVFMAWRAVPCRSREDAFVLEDRLLKQHCPPLNKRAGR